MKVNSANIWIRDRFMFEEIRMRLGRLNVCKQPWNMDILKLWCGVLSGLKENLSGFLLMSSPKYCQVFERTTPTTWNQSDWPECLPFSRRLNTMSYKQRSKGLEEIARNQVTAMGSPKFWHESNRARLGAPWLKTSRRCNLNPVSGNS